MKKNYALKNVLTLVFLCLLPISIWAIDETVPIGGNIQTAIDNVASSGGGEVTVAAGTHVVTTPLRIKSNVTLQGEGNWASTIKTNTNIQVIIADAEGLVNLVIQNIQIEGINGLNGGGIQITSQGVDHDNIKILNVHCSKTGWGVHIKGTKNLLIKDCLFDENGAIGQEGFAHNLYLRRVYDAEVRDSKFLNSISANGINISYSERVSVYNCEMSGNHFRGVRAAVTDGYLVHDCIVKNNGDRGIYANSESGQTATVNIDIRRNCVSGNTLQGIAGVSAVTGVAYDNNSYNNGTDYDLPGAVAQSGNISDFNIDCTYGSDPSVALTAVQENAVISLNWGLKNITLGNQDVYRDTDSDTNGRSLIANNVSGVNYTDNTAANDVTYWYWIEATDVSTAVYNSNAARAVIVTQPSVTITVEPGDGSVALSWEILGIELGTTGTVQIFRQVVTSTDENQQASQTGRKLLRNNVTGITYTDTDVYNGNSYRYGMKVFDENGVQYNQEESVDASPGEGLSIDDFSEKDRLNVFPNPVSSNLTMLTPTTEFTEYIIFDISGRINMRGAIPKGSSQLDIDMSHLSKGIYLISVKGNQLTKVLKIIKN